MNYFYFALELMWRGMPWSYCNVNRGKVFADMCGVPESIFLENFTVR